MNFPELHTAQQHGASKSSGKSGLENLENIAPANSLNHKKCQVKVLSYRHSKLFLAKEVVCDRTLTRLLRTSRKRSFKLEALAALRLNFGYFASRFKRMPVPSATKLPTRHVRRYDNLSIAGLGLEECPPLYPSSHHPLGPRMDLVERSFPMLSCLGPKRPCANAPNRRMWTSTKRVTSGQNMYAIARAIPVPSSPSPPRLVWTSMENHLWTSALRSWHPCTCCNASGGWAR